MYFGEKNTYDEKTKSQNMETMDNIWLNIKFYSIIMKYSCAEIKQYDNWREKVNTNDCDLVAQAAINKASLCNNHFGIYMMRSIMAGFYIVVATILSNMTAAVLLQTFPQWGKLLSSFLFAIAIILVVFMGVELFTGNNFVMAMGFYKKKVSAKDVIKVWCLSYIGNFIGSFILASLFIYSGVSHGILTEYYNSFIYTKLDVSAVQLIIRGMMCNFLVCLAVFTGTRLKSESGKLIVMFFVIMTFVLAGFEHCVANMGTFSIGYLLLGNIGTASVIKSMIFVTAGNILGGAVLFGLSLYVSNGKDD